MVLAPWRSPLARALHRNRSLAYARYLQLATVRPDGRPANRTVVFRGFLDDTDHLVFITDARSEKVHHITHLAWGEVCWYLPKTREQFRLAGPLTVVDPATTDPVLQRARHQWWQTMSDAARIQFAWPTPRQPRAEGAFDVDPPTIEQPLPCFCLVLLAPCTVDHLELRGDPQNRWLYQQHGTDWVVQAVNP